MSPVEKIINNGKIIAIIIRSKLMQSQTEKLVFYTPESFSLQLGIHNRQKGDFVVPHLHIPIDEIEQLNIQEIFFVLNGKIRVDLYDNNKKIEVTVTKGDTILLNTGHSVTFLENARMIEIKQGPYRESEKKVINNEKNF
ncbi:hypothetical protein MHK_005856 [Candidatus Magnetomorum sp. HK-1]|nr:hypothetical protein MHK_005856 [Candidatus Magnetomorum sp. HK-1]